MTWTIAHGANVPLRLNNFAFHLKKIKVQKPKRRVQRFKIQFLKFSVTFSQQRRLSVQHVGFLRTTTDHLAVFFYIYSKHAISPPTLTQHQVEFIKPQVFSSTQNTVEAV